MLLSMCELSVWAKYCTCSAQRYEFSLHSFSLCCIWFSSLHWAPSSLLTLLLHSTICLEEIPQIAEHLVLQSNRLSICKKMVWEIGLCLEPCGLAHHCLCTGMVLKINGCMLTRFDMLYKGRHLWSHDTAKQKTQQACLAKMSEVNKSTTICHIVATKC